MELENQQQKDTSKPALGAQEKKASKKPTKPVKDGRPEAIAQRKLHDMANNSPQAMRSSSFHDMANNKPLGEQTAQLNSNEKSKKNEGLPDNLKTGMENLSGISLDDVKVHRNSDKPSQLQAHAYAQGTDIHLGPGQEKHLPHELAHVVQQKQGRVKPTMQTKGGININDDAGLEKEADIMGVKALQLKSENFNSTKSAADNESAHLTSDESNSPSNQNRTKGLPIQRKWMPHPENGTFLWDKLIEGVAWFADGPDKVWYDIPNLELVPEDKREDFLTFKGHVKSYDEWQALSLDTEDIGKGSIPKAASEKDGKSEDNTEHGDAAIKAKSEKRKAMIRFGKEALKGILTGTLVVIGGVAGGSIGGPGGAIAGAAIGAGAASLAAGAYEGTARAKEVKKEKAKEKEGSSGKSVGNKVARRTGREIAKNVIPIGGAILGAHVGGPAGMVVGWAIASVANALFEGIMTYKEARKAIAELTDEEKSKTPSAGRQAATAAGAELGKNIAMGASAAAGAGIAIAVGASAGVAAGAAATGTASAIIGGSLAALSAAIWEGVTRYRELRKKNPDLNELAIEKEVEKEVEKPTGDVEDND